MVVAISIGLVLFIIGVTGCSPHPLSQIGDKEGSCRKKSSSAAIMGFMNAASDLLIFVLPIRMCWSLQLSRKRKFGLIAVFGLCLVYVREQLSSEFPSDESLAQSRSASLAQSQSLPVEFPEV